MATNRGPRAYGVRRDISQHHDHFLPYILRHMKPELYLQFSNPHSVSAKGYIQDLLQYAESLVFWLMCHPVCDGNMLFQT